MLTVFFAEKPVVDFATAKSAITARYAPFFHALLDRGLYFPPSQFESAFISTVHQDADIQLAIESARAAFATL